jgi:two-component system, OmpR family, sensor histidine kinase KdpD
MDKILRGVIFIITLAKNMKNRIVRALLSFFGPLAMVGVTTVILQATFNILNVQNIALIYLIPVMLSTALWGMIPGLLAGFISFLAFNYFFIAPYDTLLVHQSQDIITLVIFLVVSVVVSQLLGQARRAVLLARVKEWEATKMYELTAALSSSTNILAVAETLCEKMISTFHFEYAEVEVKVGKDEKKIIGAYPKANHPTQPAEMTRSLTTQREEEGVVRAWYRKHELTDGEKRLIDAFLAQSALEIERIKLSENKNKLQVLEESDLLKTSLLNSVSHELRSPLAAIKASISSLRSGTIKWEAEARKDLLATIEEETDKLNHLVGNLLDMSRIESGSLKPLLRWTSIAEIAKGAAAKMASLIHDHTLEINISEELPLIPTDYVLLEQVFTNLISNSVKYAPPKTRIRISAELKKDFMVVKVKNQSPKVDEEDLVHIFDKFHRVTQADKVIGTGLGLSICKGIIDAHGGKIWAENIEHGFMFVFTLPITMNGILPEMPEEIANG